MRDYEIWRTELFGEIRTIADAGELERHWSGIDPDAISSFAEEVSHVFDDYDIDGFVSDGSAIEVLNLEQIDALRRFRDRFAAYIDKVPPPLTSINYQTVLADPRWVEVIEAAREFVELLDKK